MTASTWSEPLRPIRGFMFDVDGTLVLSDRNLKGYELLPGAVEVLTELKARDIPFVLLTNGSAYPASEQAPKLRALGLPVTDDQMLTPSSVAADYLSRKGAKRVLLLGTPGVGAALQAAGIEIVRPGAADDTDVQAVYVGWHPDCTLREIERACHAIWAGAELCVASDVPFFAARGGKAVGSSCAIAAAIRRLTDAPMTLTGKPSLQALRFVSKKLGVPMTQVGVIGDDPLVEMIMARRGGAIGFGVTTGVTNAETWAAQPKRRRPHRVLQRVSDLLAPELMALAA